MERVAASVAFGVGADLAASRVARWAFVLMSASGFAGLGYQIVWTQQSGLWLGHETAAVLAVVAAFFGGLALGALLLGPRIDRSPRPARWYAGCEAAIGIWSLALAFLLPRVSGFMLDLIGAQPLPVWQWSVVFCGTFLLLLPATAAMGATLPAMERILAGLRAGGAPIALLYSANTFGAVLGVLAAAFVLVPRLGLLATALCCVLANLLCAALALRILPASCAIERSATPANVRRHLGVLAATGFLGIGYEVLVVRVLSQVTENTVYTFAILLAVYLVGTALGAAGYGRWSRGASSAATLQERLLQLLAMACLLGVACLAAALGLRSTVLRALGPGLAAALAAEAWLAVAAFLLPAVVMGALFSHLATTARTAGVSFGRAIGVNTLGAAFAPIICGLLLLPSLGSTLSLLAIASGYLLLAAPRSWLTPAQLTVAGAAGAIAVWAPSLALIQLPPGGRVVSLAEAPAATVSVLEDADGVATLHINNRQQEGSSATLLADARQGLLPILLHAAPHRALFLGLGTGVTSRSAAEDPSLTVDAVELLPEVIAASSRFTAAFGERPNPRFHVLTADARRFVRTARDQYDVIVADNFHPARSGSGALYTVEHFAAVRARLAAGGVFCQWLPLHQLDLDTLRSIVRGYLRVYPHAWAMLATNSLDTPVLALIARRDGEHFHIEELRARLASIHTPRPMADFGIVDDLALLGGFVAGPDALARFAGAAPLNTDDHPVVAYLAPRITYAPDSAPRDRLIELLKLLDISPRELVDGSDQAEWNRGLAAYWQARDLYLEIGARVRPTPDVRAMLAQVQEPLLSVLRISADFRPAYDPLLRMARALGAQDPKAGELLLARLARLQSGRGQAVDVAGR